jgi:hypothetical protein
MAGLMFRQEEQMPARHYKPLFGGIYESACESSSGKVTEILPGQRPRRHVISATVLRTYPVTLACHSEVDKAGPIHFVSSNSGQEFSWEGEIKESKCRLGKTPCVEQLGFRYLGINGGTRNSSIAPVKTTIMVYRRLDAPPLHELDSIELSLRLKCKCKD